ncbi:hypothetical protein FE257_007419 [Aspergillus nanangensis]|uniref:Xylanolytic transcriptional activator regulatory domain-containing protein n=1 Tax=Aspergillus nanangensis TaxID=2582783 RepID=A0AAD4CML3_ASPNN|nr:hypothetical protein FE257_007419 [Aspergillus nanangensis]
MCLLPGASLVQISPEKDSDRAILEVWVNPTDLTSSLWCKFTDRKVLGILFPDVSAEQLESMSRSQLLDLLRDECATHESTDHLLEPQNPADRPSVDEDLMSLEPSPEQEFARDEPAEQSGAYPLVTDDVNGLSLCLDESKTSYLGMSSMPAVLRVITRISHPVRQAVSQARGMKGLGHSRQGSDQQPIIQMQTTSPSDELLVVNAYFSHFHAITPMVDEVDFRARYTKKISGDSAADGRGSGQGPWLALLHMVLTLGSIAAHRPDNKQHGVFYKRASRHLDFQCVGSGNLYTVQALGLLGGYYLHYLNKPNTASAVMGAALRMATAIGLHRAQATDFRFQHSCKSAQTRMHTWWSVFCLDTWAGVTLGRPSLGRWSPGTFFISIPTPLPRDYDSLSLHASHEFCKIATRIQDRMVEPPLITPHEITVFDSELLGWQASLPPLFLTALRASSSSWCLKGNTTDRIEEEKRSIGMACLTIAFETIDTIASDWFPNQVSTWNSSWHLFQAAMVALLGFIAGTHGEDTQSNQTVLCEKSIERVLHLLREMRPWCAGATRSLEVVQFLYGAAKAACSISTPTVIEDYGGASHIVDGFQPLDTLEKEAYWNFDYIDYLNITATNWGCDEVFDLAFHEGLQI